MTLVNCWACGEFFDADDGISCGHGRELCPHCRHRCPECRDDARSDLP